MVFESAFWKSKYFIPKRFSERPVLNSQWYIINSGNSYKQLFIIELQNFWGNCKATKYSNVLYLLYYPDYFLYVCSLNAGTKSIFNKKVDKKQTLSGIKIDMNEIELNPEIKL